MASLSLPMANPNLSIITEPEESGRIVYLAQNMGGLVRNFKPPLMPILQADFGRAIAGYESSSSARFAAFGSKGVGGIRHPIQGKWPGLEQLT